MEKMLGLNKLPKRIREDLKGNKKNYAEKRQNSNLQIGDKPLLAS